jgi:hypothetical protein
MTRTIREEVQPFFAVSIPVLGFLFMKFYFILFHALSPLSICRRSAVSNSTIFIIRASCLEHYVTSYSGKSGKQAPFMPGGVGFLLF